MGGTFFVLNNVPHPGRNDCGDTMASNGYYVYILIFIKILLVGQIFVDSIFVCHLPHSPYPIIV